MVDVEKTARILRGWAVCVISASLALWFGARLAYAEESSDGPMTVSTQVEGSNSLAGIDWRRLWGADALGTMDAIVRAGEYQPDGVVVLATANGYWDALTASGIAGLSDAPVIMSDGNALSAQAKSLLELLKPQVIIVCGGVTAIDESVARAASIAAGGATVRRCWGREAPDTAVDIFTQASDITGRSWSRSAFVCTGDSYYDALSASPVSYALHMPIFLADGADDISDATLNAMKRGAFDSVYIVGGERAITPHVESAIESAGIKVAGRLWGESAIETSGEVAAFAVRNGMLADGMGVATVKGYWDALAGAAFCGRRNAVIVLVDDSSSSTISGFVRDNSSDIGTGFIFGGTAAVSVGAELALSGLLLDTASFPAETVISPHDLSRLDMDRQFTVGPVPDDVFARMAGVTFPNGCPVPRDELRYLRLLHIDADGNAKIGEMIVNQAIANDVRDIFLQLYEAGYPIERIRLAEDYGGNDEASMEANNTSAFNCRPIEGTGEMSWHGYGLAIDVNTLYNPYYYAAADEVLPVTARDYVDRSVQTPYTINRGDLCYRLFTERGFEWGGDWDYPLDYQHFEMPL